MKRLLPVLLATTAIGYSVFKSDQLQYWDGAIENWLATLLSNLVGVNESCAVVSLPDARLSC